MTQSKHTPAPWLVEFNGENFQINAEMDAICISDFCYADEKEANAHLIASAPDMLEALENSLEIIECDYLEKKSVFEDLVQRMGGEAYEYIQFEHMEEARELFNMAKQAIKKARGLTD